MGMSTEIVGFRPPDKKWNKMRDAYWACVNAGIGIPEDIDSFFDYKEPDKKGIDVDISQAISEFHEDMIDGFDVDINKLPKEVYIIRFLNSF